MARMIFVNLPVADLPRSMAFYEALGFTNNPHFTDETAAAMQWSDTIAVMLLTLTPAYSAATREWAFAATSASSATTSCF